MIKFIFPLLFLFIFALMLFYTKKRLIDKTSFSKKTKLFFYLIITFIYLFVISYFVNRFYPFLPPYLYYLATLSQGIGFIIFIFALFFEIFLFFKRYIPFSKTTQKLIEVSLFSIMIIYIGFGILNGHKDIQITQHHITTNKPIPNTLNIVFFSDLHIGGLVDVDYVKNTIDKINSTNPDIVLIGGDLIDTKIDTIKEELQQLSNIKSKYGTYFIVGNHEYFHDLEHIIYTTRTLGITPLLNETITIDDLAIQISGIYDYLGQRRGTFSPDLNALNINQNLYSLLVSHQPKVVVDEEFKNESFDLVLSGHTHCGQIAPFGLLVLLDQPYLCGEYDVSDSTKLIISAGVGFWGPKMRIGSNYEIHQINIANSK